MNSPRKLRLTLGGMLILIAVIAVLIAQCQLVVPPTKPTARMAFPRRSRRTPPSTSRSNYSGSSKSSAILIQRSIAYRVVQASATTGGARPTPVHHRPVDSSQGSSLLMIRTISGAR